MNSYPKLVVFTLWSSDHKESVTTTPGVQRVGMCVFTIYIIQLATEKYIFISSYSHTHMKIQFK